MNADWTDHYPSRERIRLETNAMLEAYVQAVLEVVPGEALRDVFFKGSANKPWDSLVDYAPELSDVDIHVWTHDDAPLGQFVSSLEAAFKLQARAEALFFGAVPEPMHVPRVQLISLNTLLTGEGFVGSPPHTVRSWFGQAYPAGHTNPAEIRALDGLNLLNGLQTSAFDPMRAVDKPSKSLRFCCGIFRGASGRWPLGFCRCSGWIPRRPGGTTEACCSSTSDLAPRRRWPNASRRFTCLDGRTSCPTTVTARRAGMRSWRHDPRSSAVWKLPASMDS